MADPMTGARGPERRQLTVMFCDVVESTSLSLRLDPEELAEVIQAYRQHCAGIIKRHDGVVARLMGDGVLAYFGYPRAHENDAERAIRAALEISGTAWSTVTTEDLKPISAYETVQSLSQHTISVRSNSKHVKMDCRDVRRSARPLKKSYRLFDASGSRYAFIDPDRFGGKPSPN